jgi:hypothetical protein
VAADTSSLSCRVAAKAAGGQEAIGRGREHEFCFCFCFFCFFFFFFFFFFCFCFCFCFCYGCCRPCRTQPDAQPKQ